MDDQPPNRSCYGHARKRLQGYERELLTRSGQMRQGALSGGFLADPASPMKQGGRGATSSDTRMRKGQMPPDP